MLDDGHWGIPWREPRRPCVQGVVHAAVPMGRALPGCAAARSGGEEVYEICKRYIGIREELRPYNRGWMKEAHELFYEFPGEKRAWSSRRSTCTDRGISLCLSWRQD